MTGRKPNIYYLICWKYLSPAVISVLLIGSVCTYVYEAVQKGGIKYSFFNPNHPKQEGGVVELDMPPHVVAIGFLLMIFCVTWVPVYYFLRKTKWKMLKDEAVADFPEDELREERNIDVEKEEDQFTKAEKSIMGSNSLRTLQEYRDQRASKTNVKGGQKEKTQ